MLEGLPGEIGSRLSAIAIDGTSGTLLATDSAFVPVSPALLYSDGRAESEAQAIANPQYGPTSGLAKRLWLARHFPEAPYCFHQADWLAALLTGKAGITDYHNALKSGFDAESLQWPGWASRLPGGHWQQKVLSPGETIGRLAPARAARIGLQAACIVRAGTTDSIAAFMAAGASDPGEAVTSLGTTLVLKLLSEMRVEDPASGVYSHRFGKLWLAGGASNSGGGVLRQFFSDESTEDWYVRSGTRRRSLVAAAAGAPAGWGRTPIRRRCRRRPVAAGRGVSPLPGLPAPDCSSGRPHPNSGPARAHLCQPARARV